jgi:quercetin dioxygenase-like cupin family protein
MIGASHPVLGGNQLSVTIDELIRTKGDPPWSAQLIANQRFVVTVICQEPGHQNDWHYHLDDECWYIYQGALSWSMEGHDEPFRVSAGDWILAPANTFHLIQVHGTGPSIRIATTIQGEYHRHSRDGITPPEPARFVDQEAPDAG